MLERSIIIFFMLLFSLPVLNTVIQNVSNNQPPVVAVVNELNTVKKVSSKYIECMAIAIYNEANGESMIGQVAVARVIMNRVLHGFGSNPCDVVYQTTVKHNGNDEPVKQCQFSWACENRARPSATNPKFVKALDIAKQVMTEDKWHDMVPNNVLFFHSTSANPKWKYRRVATIDNHVFYSTGKEKINTAAKTNK